MAGLHPHTCVYLYKCEPKKGDFHFNPCFAVVRTTEGTVHPAGHTLPTQHLPGRKTLVFYFPHSGRIESPSTLNAGHPDGVAMVTAQVLLGSVCPVSRSKVQYESEDCGSRERLWNLFRSTVSVPL